MHSWDLAAGIHIGFISFELKSSVCCTSPFWQLFCRPRSAGMTSLATWRGALRCKRVYDLGDSKRVLNVSTLSAQCVKLAVAQSYQILNWATENLDLVAQLALGILWWAGFISGISTKIMHKSCFYFAENTALVIKSNTKWNFGLIFLTLAPFYGWFLLVKSSGAGLLQHGLGEWIFTLIAPGWQMSIPN